MSIPDQVLMPHKFGLQQSHFGIVAGLLGVFLSWRRTQKSSTPLEEQLDYVSVLRTPVATELDPRAEE